MIVIHSLRQSSAGQGNHAHLAKNFVAMRRQSIASRRRVRTLELPE
jgi:hypothetical protein